MPKDTMAPFWKHCSSSPTLAWMKPVQQGNLHQFNPIKGHVSCPLSPGCYFQCQEVNCKGGTLFFSKKETEKGNRETEKQRTIKKKENEKGNKRLLSSQHAFAITIVFVPFVSCTEVSAAPFAF